MCSVKLAFHCCSSTFTRFYPSFCSREYLLRVFNLFLKHRMMLSSLLLCFSCSLVAAAPTLLLERADAGTANDVTNNVKPCRTYSVIFARGTNEGGNIGSIVGPPLLSALQAKLGNNGVAFQGVPYPARWEVSRPSSKAAIWFS